MTESFILPSALLLFLFIRKIFNFSLTELTSVFAIFTAISIFGFLMALFQGGFDDIAWYHALWASLLGVGYYLYYQVFMVCGTYALWLEKRRTLRLPENTAQFMASKIEKIAAANAKIEKFHSDKKREYDQIKLDNHRKIISKLTTYIQNEYEIFCPNKTITFEKHYSNKNNDIFDVDFSIYKIFIEEIEILKIYFDGNNVNIHSSFTSRLNKSKKFKNVGWKNRTTGDNNLHNASKFCLDILKNYCKIEPKLFL
jgi:hypothetical protein